MYILANGREVTTTDIVDALSQGRAGIIDDAGVHKLVLHVTPLEFDSVYFICGTPFLVVKPANREEALAAAYF